MMRPRSPASTLALTLALWACATSTASSAPYSQSATSLSSQKDADATQTLSAQIAACRRLGNLFAFYQPLGRCMALLDEAASPCVEAGDVLVLNATTYEASCFRLPCASSQVLLADGRCHDKRAVCAGRENTELVLLETGLGACDCRDGHVFWRADGRCHAVYTRGPCAPGQHLMWRAGEACCEATTCPEGQVPWRSQCVPRAGHGCLDSKHGHLRLNAATLRYQCTLRCPDAMVEVGLDCYPLYSRGPCSVAEYVEPVRGTRYGRCAPNPCERDGLLPWAGKCWRAGQPCGADDDDDWEETMPTVETRTTRAPPSLLFMAYSDLIRAAAATAPPMRAFSRPVARPVERVSLSSSESTPPPAPTMPSTVPTMPSTTTTTAPPASTTRSSLPLHLQYLLGNAPSLDQLPFMVHRRPPPPPPLHAPPPPPHRAGPPSASVSEALVARRSLVPPPPPASASGLLELIGLRAFHGQASETSMSSLPPPMMRPVQYTYDGKMIPNPLFHDGRQRRSVSAGTPSSAAAPSPSPAASGATGARIVVHPDSRSVACTADMLLAAPESYAHFKCRPGSRRDALGECFHSGSTLGELHPRRCPHGMRHNRLTGQCRPAT